MIVAVCIFTGSYNHLRLSLAEAGLFLLELIPVAQEWAKAFYKSGAWLKCRAAYIQSVFGLCEKCGRPGWIVHHKIKLTPGNINDPNVTLNWDNLEYLCQDCHNSVHGLSSTADGLMFDERGDLVEHPPV